MHQFTRILFNVDSFNTDCLNLAIGVFFVKCHLNFALAHNRVVKLRNLVALRQIGIEIILPIEPRPAIDLRIYRHAGTHGLTQTFTVGHGQHARHRGVDKADMAVRFGPKAGG